MLTLGRITVLYVLGARAPSKIKTAKKDFRGRSTNAIAQNMLKKDHNKVGSFLLLPFLDVFLRT